MPLHPTAIMLYGPSMRATDRIASLAAFLVLVVPLVVYCAWAVPTGQVPDEPTHVLRAASLLHGEIIGRRVDRTNVETGAPDAGVTGNTGLALAAMAGNGDMAPLPPDAPRAARRAWVSDIPWQPELSFVSSANTAAYAPVAYMPAALGLGAAILMGAKPHAAIIGARLANVLAFTLIGALALLLAARGRLLLLITLSLPMTIWLAGSCSQDGVVFAVSVLGAALLTRDSAAGFWCGCAALGVLVLQKPPFLPLAILPLVVPGGFERSAWVRRLAGVAVVAVPGLLWSAAVAALVAVPLLPGPPYHPGPLWPGDPARLFRSANVGAQIDVLLHHPLRIALLPVTVGGPSLPFYWREFIGNLGQLSIRLPPALYTVWSGAILSGVGALLATRRAPGDRWLTSAAAIIAMLGSIELIVLVMYLTWTPVGMDRVDGIQGRYFTPLLPILLFAVPRLTPPRLPGWVWWLVPLAAIVTTDAALPRLIDTHFYR